jgi:hypothetical protein
LADKLLKPFDVDPDEIAPKANRFSVDQQYLRGWTKGGSKAVNLCSKTRARAFLKVVGPKKGGEIFSANRAWRERDSRQNRPRHLGPEGVDFSVGAHHLQRA